MIPRVIFGLVLLLSALFLPFWVTAGFFVLSILFFDRFYLGLFVMLLINLLHGFKGGELFGIYGSIFFLSVIVFFLSENIKKFILIKK